MLVCLWNLLFFSACSRIDRQQVDTLNDISYAYHYRNIDSTETYARRAYALAGRYGEGRAEALNNMAFVSMARMDYEKAQEQLSEALKATDNQVEQLISLVMQMRLCQRMSNNREFYDYSERAKAHISRINEERDMLPERLRRRMIYAESEYAIVHSTYYYYVGLERQSVEALMSIDPNGEIKKDTAQYLNYLYNIGAGGIINKGAQADINQQEFETLLRCYFTANKHGYDFFAANSLEAMSEHVVVEEYRDRLLSDNIRLLGFILPDSIDDDFVAGWMAGQALEIFQEYGDVYQVAGAHRTLASCFMELGDYESALFNFEQALSDPKIEQAPDLVASIREQLSVAYSAINDKQASDYNRNIYIDLQEQTRQDRYLESRAGMLEKASSQLNWLITAVLIAIFLLVFTLWIFYYLNRKSSRKYSMDELLIPLREWQESDKKRSDSIAERMEEINESYALSMSHIRQGERRGLENRAKVSLVNSIVPFIDRMINEVNQLSARREAPDVRAARYAYISELTGKINEYNDVLTHWIQMRQGRIDLHIESFHLQPLFDIVAKGKTGFRMNGVELCVSPTNAKVKADRVLTLFMINTLADNARKFTPGGGTVTIDARQTDDYVEISVTDTGCGMTDAERDRIFDHKIYNGHGFGLMNCRGIIEKYRKISQIFSVCLLSAESKQGRGSRFFFRLPRGVARSLVALFVLSGGFSIHATVPTQPSATVEHPVAVEGNLSRAKAFADSAYFSNINGTYGRTLEFADSCRKYLNSHYLELNPDGKILMLADGSTSLTPPEVKWFQDSLPTNYGIIIDMRNESAVAALALHRWRLYTYNNKVYTQLFKEVSADNTLADYCRVMQQSQTNKTIAVIILVLILVMIPPASYLLYYRHRLYFRFCVERIKSINDILLSDDTPSEKLRRIEPLTHEQYPADLNDVVNRILQALRDAVSSRQRQSAGIELAEDECRRAEYEDNNLYISNSVLDNCLSTLKHETMYYPSRISQLIDGSDDNLAALSELIAYYRDIYSILSEQAMRQTECVKIHVVPVDASKFASSAPAGLYVAGDSNMLEYLFEILKRGSGQRKLDVTVEPKDDQYLLFTVVLPALCLTESQAQQLFTPSVDNIPYLLCRQIVRDHSEATNRRGCGIDACLSNGQTVIRVTLPRSRYGKRFVKGLAQAALPDV